MSTEDSRSPGNLPPLPQIKDQKLKKQIFTHKSVTNQQQFQNKAYLLHEHNERLEFLGDAVLNFIMSELVYLRFPNLPEGELTTIRSAVVCNDKLWEWAVAYGLDQQLRTQFDIFADVDGKRSKLVADLMEAYIGGLVIEHDYSYEVVRKWLAKLADPTLKLIEEERKSIKPLDKNAKNNLYDAIGSNDLRPTYVTVVEGDSLHPFTVECRLGDDVLGVGTGASTKEAGWRAAMEALQDSEKIKYYSKLRDAIPEGSIEPGMFTC